MIGPSFVAMIRLRREIVGMRGEGKEFRRGNPLKRGKTLAPNEAICRMQFIEIKEVALGESVMWERIGTRKNEWEDRRRKKGWGRRNSSANEAIEG